MSKAEQPTLRGDEHPSQLRRLADALNEHPSQIGNYRILEILGEGAMGTVYKAEQRAPVQRLVAIKLIRMGMASRDVLARFETDAGSSPSSFLSRRRHSN